MLRQFLVKNLDIGYLAMLRSLRVAEGIPHVRESRTRQSMRARTGSPAAVRGALHLTPPNAGGGQEEHHEPVLHTTASARSATSWCVRYPLSGDPHSPPSSLRPTSCSPQRRATPPAHSSRSAGIHALTTSWQVQAVKLMIDDSKMRTGMSSSTANSGTDQSPQR
jgi:hypothetical protein